MISSPDCLKLIQHFETLKLKAYLDIFGVPTIGWGHTKNVKLGSSCTKEQADKYVKDTPSLSFLSFYLNHFSYDEKQNNPPLTISCREMENFIIATCNNSEHLKFVDESQCHFKGGETVRIILMEFSKALKDVLPAFPVSKELSSRCQM